MNTKYLFTLLVKLKDEILTQIPCAPNRSGLSDTWTTVEEVIAAEAENRKRKRLAECQRALYEFMTEEFARYCQNNHYQIGNEIPKLHQKDFIDRVNAEIKVFISKLSASQYIYLGAPGIDEQGLQECATYSYSLVEKAFEKLCQGLSLELDDKYMADLNLKNKELERYRAIIDQEIAANNAIYELGEMDEKTQDIVIKSNCFIIGTIIDQVKANTAYCEEYTCLALTKMFSNSYIYENFSHVEKVSIEYGGNGHTFLAINRDEKSDIKDIASWGVNAILFDPWNKLLCMATDYAQQTRYHPYFPKKYDWYIEAKFAIKDIHILQQLTLTNTCFQVTGLTTYEQRLAALIEEHELISLNKPELGVTKAYLHTLFAAVKPVNLTVPVDIYLTTGGNEYVTHYIGFKHATIGVHVDFLRGMGEVGKFTLEELKFALGNAGQYIYNHGIGICQKLQIFQQNKLDKNTLTICGDGHAAISYLRKSISFKKENKQAHLKLPSFFSNYESSLMASNEQRIKNLMTLLATNSKWAIEKPRSFLPAPIINELQIIIPQYFFADQFHQKPNRIEKINYLICCLPELRIELLPYELVEKPSVRVREFCRLLKELNVDLMEKSELEAINDLLQIAHTMKIPALEQIYCAAAGKKVDKCDKDLPALGLFSVLQKHIDEVMHANHFIDAYGAACYFLDFLPSIKPYFIERPLSMLALNYIKSYQLNNNFRLPAQRYFGSRMGRRIIWQGFPLPYNRISPWQQHLLWAKENTSGLIAKALFLIGLNHAPEIWSAIESMSLYKLLDQSPEPLIAIDQAYSLPIRIPLISAILNHISSNHHVDETVFTQNLSFDAAFVRFYDTNILALICPELDKFVNVDNAAVNCLLKQFTRIALSGTQEEKAVVKSFFMGRPDARDLLNLTKAFQGRSSGSLTAMSHYYQFIISQRYKRTKFDLFTQRDVLQAINYVGLSMSGKILAKDYLKIYRLNHKDITLDCLKELFEILKKEASSHLSFAIPISKMFLYYIETGNKSLLLSRASVDKFKFDADCVKVFKFTEIYQILKKTTWFLPDSLLPINDVSLEEIILVYLSYDSTMAFPSTEEQVKFSSLILEKILSLPASKERMTFCEQILSDKASMLGTPITDVRFIGHIIDVWVAAARIEFNIDDGSKAYQDKLSPMITRLANNISNRDLVTLFAKLTTELEFQHVLSMMVGIRIDPEAFLHSNRKSYQADALGVMGKVSSLISENPTDIQQFLNFISNPLSVTSLNIFADYLVKHKKLYEFSKLICKVLDCTSMPNKDDLKIYLTTLYHLFWERPLEERCAIIEYTVIPASKVTKEADYLQAYNQALVYIAMRLFKQSCVKDSDDELALAFLISYLAAADKYQRSLLLSGLLVASNKMQSEEAQPSVSKILATLCEHMGPAYIKFAQAIHSHPDTAKHIRRELDHIKGRANPPYRWHLFRLMSNVLPKEVLEDIAHVEQLIGSASYNLALIVTMKSTGKRVVLSLSRENAREDALQGFKHLKTAIENCHHPRLETMRSALLSMLTEAQAMSELELDHVASTAQFAIAEKLYKQKKYCNGYTVNISPCQLIHIGKGYRLIELIDGIEFNDLPHNTPYEQQIKNIAAKSIFAMELEFMLSGKKFDSDRHGNQLRLQINEANKTIQIGLYDFGEMALEDPTESEVTQLGNVFTNIPLLLIKKLSFSTALDTALSEQINLAAQKNVSSRYLMRVRKGLLALQDYQSQLSNFDIIDILLNAIETKTTHPLFSQALTRCVDGLKIAHRLYSTSTTLFNKFNPASTTINPPNVKSP